MLKYGCSECGATTTLPGSFYVVEDVNSKGHVVTTWLCGECFWGKDND